MGKSKEWFCVLISFSSYLVPGLRGKWKSSPPEGKMSGVFLIHESKRIMEYQEKVLGLLEAEYGYTSKEVILGSVSAKDMQISSDKKEVLKKFLEEVSEKVLRKIIFHGDNKIEAVASWF